MPMRIFLTLLLTCLLALSATAELADVDLYGSEQITIEDIEARYGAKLEEIERLLAAGEHDAARKLVQEIEDGIAAMGDFAYVDISRIRYFQEGQPVYVTIDLVDAGDEDRRLAFSPEPEGQFGDPEKLLATWKEYEALVMQLLSQGKIDPAGASCPAFHCIVGFGSPELAKYGETFESRVPVHKEALKKILAESGDAGQRAYAAYLLAHVDDGDGEELLAALLPAVNDSSSLVRNNVLRVLQQVAREQADLTVPLEPVLQALDFPATTDRNKALATLAGLAERPGLRDEIARRAGATLIDILELSQPNNHDFAYQILQKISGESFGERDYDAWRSWLKKSSAVPEP